jgi:hypothetical protein
LELLTLKINKIGFVFGRYKTDKTYVLRMTGAPTNKPPFGGFFVGASRRFEPSSTKRQDSRLARRKATPEGRAPGMARVNPDGAPYKSTT